jgi:adenylate cyclase
MVVIDPLLRAAELRPRFIHTVILWNVVAYPITLGVWIRLVLSLRPAFRRLLRGESLEGEQLDRIRRRLVNLPWYGAAISGLAWLLCLPVFLLSLSFSGSPLTPQLYWHLPISFAVSGFIAITQSFYLIELATHWGLFSVFFRSVRPDQLQGVRPISLRTRGLIAHFRVIRPTKSTCNIACWKTRPKFGSGSTVKGPISMSAATRGGWPRTLMPHCARL